GHTRFARDWSSDVCSSDLTIRVAEQSQHLVKGRWGTEGAVRMQDAFVVPPQRLREFQPGDVVYAHGGRGYWGAVALVPPMRPAEARKSVAQGHGVEHGGRR